MGQPKEVLSLPQQLLQRNVSKGTFSFFWLHSVVISKMNVDKIVYTCFRELALLQIRLWAQGGWTKLPLWSYKNKWLLDM